MLQKGLSEIRAWNKKEKRMISPAEGYNERICICTDGWAAYGSLKGDWTDDLIFMRSTGLEDSHGKKIFEGDVVQWDDKILHSQKGFIVYHLDYGRFSVAWANDLKSYLKDGFHGTARFIKSDKSDEPLKIIGNIYENPELLKTK